MTEEEIKDRLRMYQLHKELQKIQAKYEPFNCSEPMEKKMISCWIVNGDIIDMYEHRN